MEVTLLVETARDRTYTQPTVCLCAAASHPASQQSSCNSKVVRLHFRRGSDVYMTALGGLLPSRTWPSR